MDGTGQADIRTKVEKAQQDENGYRTHAGLRF
jgi:hypothetical protein